MDMLFFELILPILIPTLVGAFAASIIPGPKEKRGRRIAIGAVGGFVGAFVGLWVAIAIVKMPGWENIATVAIFGTIGVIGGVLFGRLA